MDNASICRSEQVAQMYEDAGVKFFFLPAYSPDLNLIEEFFSDLKSFIKRNWRYYESDPDPVFPLYSSASIL